MPAAGLSFMLHTMKPRSAAILAAVLLAGAIHVDWHLARPEHHARLSGGFSQHWLLAVPVFGILAAIISTSPATRRWRNGALWIGGGALLGQIVEPLGEVLIYRLPWGQLVVGIRWTAFAEFMAGGMLTFLVIMAWRERSNPPSP